MFRSDPPKLKHACMALTTIVFLLCGLFMIIFVNQQMRNQALVEARAKALAILDHNLAIHTYFSHDLKPRLFAWTEPFRSDDHFDPTWMSSTYAVRKIHDYFDQLNHEELYYKEAAINARSSENEADAFERAFLERLLGRDPDLIDEAEILYMEGEPWYVVLRRGESLEQSCLRCHGDPADAPKGIIEKYGDKRGFGRTADASSAQAFSIRIPLAQAYARANELSFHLSAILLLILGSLYLVHFLMAQYMIFGPLEAIQMTALAIADKKKAPGAQIPRPFWREWRELVSAFNQMSSSVGETIGNLNRLVDEKTFALQNTNRQLHHEIMEREEAEEMFKKFFEANLNYCYIVSPRGIILKANASALQIMGYDREELIGQPVEKLYAPEYQERRREIISEWKRTTGIIDGVELVIMTRSGQRRTVILSVNHVFDSKGEILHSISVQTDITERKAAEAEIQRMDDQLRQAQKMESVGQLAGGVAHDFNNLLYVIMGYAEMAQMQAAGNERLMANIREILYAGEQAANLVRQLLLFSRKEAMQLKVLALNELISGLMKMMQRVIGEHIHLAYHPGYDLKRIFGDPGQLEQVLINLCVNARDAMPGGGKIVIETENFTVDTTFCQEHHWSMPGEYVSLIVSDTGTGMTPEIREKIFEPFFTTKEVGKGTGLGLSAAYGIVKSHGGMIDVYSEPEQGSVFRIYLPVLTDAPGADISEERESVEIEEISEALTILVVEDEGKVRKLACLILTKAGYQVIEAPDGEAAIEIIKTRGEEIDLVLLDVIMPKAGGDLVYERIAALYPDMPVVFMTGYSRGLLPEIFTNHTHEILQKPFNRARLLNKVKEALAGPKKG